MDEAEQLWDRITIMDRGTIIALGTPRELVASIGVEQIVEFSVGGEAREIDLSSLRNLEGVRDVLSEGESVRMQVTELHWVVPAILAEMERQGIALTELRTHSSTLEDVFVSLTGRRLRDE